MKITISDFLSLKNVDFEIEKGVTVIAGKNGCGKSQLLLGIAQRSSSSNLLKEFGFSSHDVESATKHICIDYPPSLVLYRPSIRIFGENEKNIEYGFCRPLNDIINSNNAIGYTNNVQNRPKNIYSIISNFAIAANDKKSTSNMQQRWHILTSSFKRVFGKDLLYDVNIFNGVKVGIDVGNNFICSFNTLSTGELEFISLLCDLLLECNMSNSENETNKMTGREIPKADMIIIDELDAHFHPDLQSKIISEINNLCTDKYVLISTHSPSVMLSVSPEKLFYLDSSKDCFDTRTQTYRNQITQISKSYSIFKKISDLYNNFSTDIRYSDFIKNSQNYEIIKFAEECMLSPEVINGDKGKENDPQISTIQNFLLAHNNPIIVEIGCGLGRTLSAFKSIDPDFLKQTTYFGLDIEEKNIEGIKRYAQENGISQKFKNFDAGLNFYGKADICIFANVLHEIPRKNLIREIKKYFNHLNPGGHVLILECLELPIGETDYVVFDFKALQILFNKNIENGAIKLRSATPKSYSGIPLMNVVIDVIHPEQVNILKKDLIKSLQYIIDSGCQKLIDHFNKTSLLSPKSFAHTTHNIAHAEISIFQLQNNNFK